MRRISDNLLVLLAVVALAGFAIGTALLLDIPFGAGGSVYPAYSTFRSDPLGTEVLYKALHKLPRVTARRNLVPLLNLPDGRGRALFLLDVSGRAAVPKDEMDAIQRFVLTGGRLVVSLAVGSRRFTRPGSMGSKPEKQVGKKARRSRKEKAPEAKSGPKPPRRKKPTASKRSRTIDSRVPVRELFMALGSEVVPPGPGATAESATDAMLAPHVHDSGPVELPEELPWRSRASFKPLDAAWQTIYAVKGRPVVLERTSGSGSIVLLGESYLLSNEALQRDLYTGFLAWLAGTGREMIFDEEHLGVSESMGVAKLLRRSGLHGLLAGLLLLGGLWLWREATPFLPRTSRHLTPPPDNPTAGKKDAAQGLDNLLRRSIPARELLSVCLNEWEKSLPGRRKKPEAISSARRLVATERDAPATERDPVASYNLLCQVLSGPRAASVPTADAGEPETDVPFRSQNDA